MGLLQNKVALVTGGSRGIGKAIVLDLAAEGANVAFTFQQNETAANQVVSEILGKGKQALAIQADVTDFARAQQVVDQVVTAWGRLDILVNNAGVHQNEPIWSIAEEVWDNVLASNLKGVFNYIRAVAPLFRQQLSGKIVTISSIHGLRGREAGPNYSAAKAGVIGLSKSVARDLGPYGVNVNVIAPGTIETDMVRNLSPDLKNNFLSQIVLGKFGQPEDVAYLVTFLCSSRAKHITGSIIKVDGGQYI